MDYGVNKEKKAAQLATAIKITPSEIKPLQTYYDEASQTLVKSV